MFPGPANHVAVPRLTSSTSGQWGGSLGVTAAGPLNTVLRARSVRGKDFGQPGTGEEQPITARLVPVSGIQSPGMWAPPLAPSPLDTLTGDAHRPSLDGSILK